MTTMGMLTVIILLVVLLGFIVDLAIVRYVHLRLQIACNAAASMVIDWK